MIPLLLENETYTFSVNKVQRIVLACVFVYLYLYVIYQYPIINCKSATNNTTKTRKEPLLAFDHSYIFKLFRIRMTTVYTRLTCVIHVTD